MKRFFNQIAFLFTLLAVLGITLTLSMTKAYAAAANIRYITTSVGETYESAGVNYHCDVSGSYVIYSTEYSLQPGLRVTPEATAWSAEAIEGDKDTGFANRFICRAQLTNLLPKTTYYYQIICGSEKSAIKSFTTPEITDPMNKFLFITDTQNTLSGYAKTETMLQKIARKERNINMAFMTGDLVDRGGHESQWQAFFNGIPTLQTYQLATIPGNHEYYHSTTSSAYVSPEYYNQFFYNPQNGPQSRINSSYYFTYGNVLFILLDVIKKDNIAEHQTWFRQVVAANPAKWIIVGTHAGCISTGAYKDDAKFMMKNWQSVFEECQVDLALSGHEHIYARKDNYYQTEKDETMGVTYLIGPAGGLKSYTAQNKDGFDAVIQGNYMCNVIEVGGSTLTVKLYDVEATEQTSFTLNAKRFGSIAPLTDQEILDSITIQYDKINEQATISWAPTLWEQIRKIDCSGNATWSKIIASNAIQTHVLYGIYTDYNYQFHLILTKADGSTLNKEIKLTLKEEKPTPTPDQKSCSAKCSTKNSFGLMAILSAFALCIVTLFRKKQS